MGVWVTVDSNSFLGVLNNVEGIPSEVSQLVYVSYLLIALGSVLLIIGFLGCCGAVRESRCMLLTVRMGGWFYHLPVSCQWVVAFSIRPYFLSSLLTVLHHRTDHLPG